MRAGVFAEGKGVQLIEGELVEVEVQGTPHAVSVGLTQDVFSALFGAGHTVRVQLPLALGDYSQPEPDVAVVRGSRREYLEDHPSAAATMLVVEVSDSTLAFDREKKASMYARAGIQDFWIVNLVDRQIEVYREPLEVPGASSGWQYRTRILVPEGQAIAPLALPDQRVSAADLLP
jgi:Uma2 family endonuclease